MHSEQDTNVTSSTRIMGEVLMNTEYASKTTPPSFLKSKKLPAKCTGRKLTRNSPERAIRYFLPIEVASKER